MKTVLLNWRGAIIISLVLTSLVSLIVPAKSFAAVNSGTWISAPIGHDQLTKFSKLEIVDQSQPAGTTVGYEFSGQQSDYHDWSNSQSLSSDGAIDLSNNPKINQSKYLRVRITLTSSSTESPSVTGFAISYVMESVPTNLATTADSQSKETTQSTTKPKTVTTQTAVSIPPTTATKSPFVPSPTLPVTATTAVSFIQGLTVSNKQVDPNLPPVIVQGDKLHLSTIVGAAGANETVTVSVYSEPKTYTVQADKNGQWSIDISTLDLAAGQHRIEYATPTKVQTKLVEFTIIEPTTFKSEPLIANTVQPKVTKNNDPKLSRPVLIYVLAVVLVLLVILLVVLKKKRKLRQLKDFGTDSLRVEKFKI